ITKRLVKKIITTRLLLKRMEASLMQEEKQPMINDPSHLSQKSGAKEFVMLRPHRQHQFHCDDIQKIMDANARQNKVSLHVPPYFQEKH
ncbi:hypothetical protein PMV48_15040, partial [Enterococcus avium]